MISRQCDCGRENGGESLRIWFLVVAQIRSQKFASVTGAYMAYPRFNDVFYLATDASTIAIGGCLMQYNKELDWLLLIVVRG